MIDLGSIEGRFVPKVLSLEKCFQLESLGERKKINKVTKKKKEEEKEKEEGEEGRKVGWRRESSRSSWSSFFFLSLLLLCGSCESFEQDCDRGIAVVQFLFEVCERIFLADLSGRP